MIPEIIERTPELEQFCGNYAVSRLDLFGPAAANFPAEQPALSFLVKFQPLPPGDYANAYFGLLESLEQLFGRPVELVSDLAVKNPYFRQSIEETRTPLYSVYADAA